jgi:micrococcal nuclease
MRRRGGRAGYVHAGVMLVVFLTATACTRSESGTAVADSGTAVVTRTVDGDTVYVRYRGREFDVRLIGIDTPEVDPSIGVECFGDEASRFTDRVLAGESVRLEFDVERYDRFDRVLAYVWFGGRLFNERLVAEGYAVVTTFPPNVRYEDRFLTAEEAARDEGRGLWGACDG